MLNNKKIIVVLPAYNAAKTLKVTVEAIPRRFVDDIILVDDASKYDTVEVAKKLGLKIFVHERNLGYGGNQKTCYKEALKLGADIVVMVHPDFQYDPSFIPQMIEPIAKEECDAVFGSRMMVPRNALAGGMPYWKFIANIALTKMENIVLGMNLTEYHSGFRAYAKKVLQRLPLQHNSNDFVFDTEIIAQMKIASMKIKEIPIATRYFPEASMIGFKRSLRYGMGIIVIMIKYILHMLRFVRLLRFVLNDNEVPGAVCIYCKSLKPHVAIRGTSLPKRIFKDRYLITEANSGIYGDIYSCPDCGFYFVDRGGLGEDIKNYYKNQSLDHNYLRDKEGRGKSFGRVIEKMRELSSVSGKPKLLEIGCGPGIFLHQARERQFEVFGIDPSSEACEFARKNFKLSQVFEGDEKMIETKFSDESFDSIAAFDVIEHVNDTKTFFAIVYKKLKPGGSFVITTPLIDSVAAKVLGRRRHAILPSHINYFIRQTLKNFYESYGYRLLFKRFYRRYLSVNYLLSRFFHTPRVRVPDFLNFTVPVNLFDEIELYLRK